MDALECPQNEIWNTRKDWIESEIEESMTGFSYMVSDHATALFMDLQICYCAGAFLSVIILSVSIIDAHLRETEALDTNIGTAKLLNDFYTGQDINWLRQLRNKYVHINLNSPALKIDDQYDNREIMEVDVRKAIKMILHALFQSPGT